MHHWKRYVKRHHHNHILCNQYHREFPLYYRYFKWQRPGVLLFNLFLLYLLYKWVGNIVVILFFAVFFAIKELIHLRFLLRLEKRIIEPIDKLKNGVEEIAKGNYSIRIESGIPNEVGQLINAFNGMAKKLEEIEALKEVYEENRKALIANISHDLKTPISSIQGYIEVLTEDKMISPEKLEKYLKIIKQNTNYINKLIDDLFLFAKLDMKKLDFKFEEVQIKAFLQDMMEELKIELEEKNVGFSYIDNIKEELSVSLDRKRIYQVIRNIIANAMKYGHGDNLLIQVQVFFQDNNLAIAIKDNGPGIPKEKLGFIFDRFYRIDAERTKDLTGTGLGLAIAKEIIEAHGGSIAVSSQEREGTCFTVILPGQ